MKIKWKSGSKEYWITEFVTTVTWSGADTQASRSLEFELVNTPYDKATKVPALKGGDIITFYDDSGTARFTGRITNKTKLSEIGTRQYTARDYMHNLVQSKASYIFKKKTAEYITRAICKDMMISISALVKTKKKIKKYVAQGMSPYDIIDKAYKKAKTGAKYLLVMNGTKLAVVKRGGAITGFHLDSTKDIINMEFNENADSMINQVAIYNKNNKKIGVVKNADWIKLYGIYQDVFETDKKKKKATKANKAEAKKQLQGVEKKTTCEAIGDIRCISGRAITILDRATMTSTEFWIKSDSHTWENGTVIKKFSNAKGKKKHLGIDIKVASGTQIHAAEAGTVASVSKDKTLGKTVTIKHKNGLKTIYACCSSVSVKKGQKVKKGAVIAKAGSSGSEAKKAQCHFGVKKNNAWKNPLSYVK